MNQAHWTHNVTDDSFDFISDERVSPYSIGAHQVATPAKLVEMMEHLLLTKPWGTAPVVGALFECVAKRAWEQGHRIGGGTKT